MRCHARLTKYNTRSVIGEGKHYALQAYICKAPVKEGLLCLACSNRSRTHQKNVQRLHGLLTEPIPENSHIYGGSWYLRQVEAHGEPPSEWVAEAAARQAEAEQWVEGAFKVKPIESTEVRDMATSSSKQKQKQKQKQKKAPEVLPLTKLFPPKLTPLYKEVPKSVVTMSTDYRTIVKGVHNGEPVWVLPNGKMMLMDEQGEPRGFL
jgi:hypothetical protein